MQDRHAAAAAAEGDDEPGFVLFNRRMNELNEKIDLLATQYTETYDMASEAKVATEAIVTALMRWRSYREANAPTSDKGSQ